MAVGLTMIERAQVRPKNREHVVIKNMFIFVITLITFFVAGYAIAFGGTTVGIVGAQSEWVGVFTPNGLYHERQFPFYFSTSLLVAILATGSMNERTRLKPLMGYVVLLQILIYPVILSWAWNIQEEGGFLRQLGFFDRGGAVVIFQTGSLAGVLGAIILGPRYGLFMRKKTDDAPAVTTENGSVDRVELRKSLGTLLEEALDETVDVDDMFLAKVRRLIKTDCLDTNFYYMISVPGMVLGTFLTVIGFSMLNTCGALSHSLNSAAGRYAAEIALLNTFISGSVCAFISFLLKRHVVIGDHWLTPRYDIRSLCNGYLSGVTAVAAGAGAMKPWSALVTGTFQAFIYMLACLIMQRVKFDDAMENFQTFGTASFTAMFASVFFLPNQGILWSSTNSGSILGV
jgi:ammonia channel protein AmtB